MRKSNKVGKNKPGKYVWEMEDSKKVAEYCTNDVVATEKVFNHFKKSTWMKRNKGFFLMLLYILALSALVLALYGVFLEVQAAETYYEFPQDVTTEYIQSTIEHGYELLDERGELVRDFPAGTYLCPEAISPGLYLITPISVDGEKLVEVYSSDYSRYNNKTLTVGLDVAITVVEGDKIVMEGSEATIRRVPKI